MSTTNRAPLGADPSTDADAASDLAADLNLVVLRGEISADATVRDLPSGSTVAQFDVRTRPTDEVTAISTPIAVNDPSPAVAKELVAGTEVLVVGRVKRRFFRVAGATQSRTEVVALSVVPTRRRRQAQRILAAAAESLGR